MGKADDGWCAFERKKDHRDQGKNKPQDNGPLMDQIQRCRGQQRNHGEQGHTQRGIQHRLDRLTTYTRPYKECSGNQRRHREHKGKNELNSHLYSGGNSTTCQ